MQSHKIVRLLCLRFYAKSTWKIQTFCKFVEKGIMDIQTLKLELVQRIINSKNEAILAKVNLIFEEESEKDWWDELPQEIRDSISDGIRDIDSGKIYSHDQVMLEAKTKYGF